jgi:hypothetical protein
MNGTAKNSLTVLIGAVEIGTKVAQLPADIFSWSNP